MRAGEHASVDADARSRDILRAMGPDGPSLKKLILAHKRAAAGVIAVVLVLVGVMVGAALPSARDVSLSDSSTCSAWGSASQAQRSAYARRYVAEYASNGARDQDTTEADLTGACNHAAYLGEADDISLVAAMNHAF